jgi:hypothetical protein
MGGLDFTYFELPTEFFIFQHFLINYFHPVHSTRSQQVAYTSMCHRGGLFGEVATGMWGGGGGGGGSLPHFLADPRAWRRGQGGPPTPI